MKPHVLPEQATKLRAAIDAALGHGECRYVAAHSREPFCVIAQLGAKEGISIEAMERWDKREEATVDNILVDEPTAAPLKTYPPKLLDGLQNLWDNRDTTTNEARAWMHELVDQYAP